MFERYTELARRTVFFARYEASKFGSPYIETEHLLLGLLREDRSLRERLPAGATEQMRQRIDERSPRGEQSIPTSVDLPLSAEARRVLAYAAEESETLKHPFIDGWHLVLGMLRVETSTAAAVLREFGVGYASLRLDPPGSPVGHRQPRGLAQTAASLRDLLNAVIRIEEQGGQRLKRVPWTRKQALGHLIDCAAAHQQWFARALADPKLTATGYPEDSWPTAQKYDDLAWMELVDLWLSLNRLLAHVIASIPDETMNTPCRIGIAEPVPLQELARRYVVHCEDIVGQLLMRG
jgi:hypothetical protein